MLHLNMFLLIKFWGLFVYLCVMCVVTSSAVCRNKVGGVKVLVAFVTSALHLSWAPVWAGASKHFMNAELEILIEYLGLLYHMGVVTFLSKRLDLLVGIPVCVLVGKEGENLKGELTVEIRGRGPFA